MGVFSMKNGHGLKITHALMSCPSPHIPILLMLMLSVYMSGFDTGFFVWVGREREGPISLHGTPLTYLHNESRCMLSTGSLHVLLTTNLILQNSYKFFQYVCPPCVLISCSCTYSYCCLFVHVDPTFTLENVSTVLATVVDVEELRDALLVPERKLEEIQQQSSTVTQVREGLINYFIKYSEYASWTDLTNSLYEDEHHEAVAAAKTFIKQTPGKYIHVVTCAVVDCQYNTHVHVNPSGCDY